jgi:hypothetical protein
VPRLHGRCRCLGLKAPVTGVKRRRECDCSQLMRGRVKKGKGWSLELHGTGGREGAAPMTWVACRGGSGVIAGSGWRREGERGSAAWWVGSACWPLDMLARRPLGQKAELADGRLGRLGQNLKRKPFKNKNWIFNLPRLWKFVQGDLGGILTQGFFPKFF